MPRAVILSSDVNLTGALGAILADHFAVESIRSDPGVGPRYTLDAPYPDVIVIDLLPERDSATLTELMATAPSLVLGPDDSSVMIEAVEAGAIGYLSRETPLSQIGQVAVSVSEGVAVIPPFMLGALLHHIVEQRRVEAESAARLDDLTPREHEVFELAAMGMGHDAISDRLFMSPATARTHLHRIFKKLTIHSKAELVALAAACGLATTEEP